MMTDVENMFQDNELLHQKKVLNSIGNEDKVLGSKKQWTHARDDKASDETINKTC